CSELIAMPREAALTSLCIEFAVTADAATRDTMPRQTPAEGRSPSRALRVPFIFVFVGIRAGPGRQRRAQWMDRVNGAGWMHHCLCGSVIEAGSDPARSHG